MAICDKPLLLDLRSCAASKPRKPSKGVKSDNPKSQAPDPSLVLAPRHAWSQVTLKKKKENHRKQKLPNGDRETALVRQDPVLLHWPGDLPSRDLRSNSYSSPSVHDCRNLCVMVACTVQLRLRDQCNLVLEAPTSQVHLLQVSCYIAGYNVVRSALVPSAICSEGIYTCCDKVN